MRTLGGFLLEFVGAQMVWGAAISLGPVLVNRRPDYGTAVFLLGLGIALMWAGTRVWPAWRRGLGMTCIYLSISSFGFMLAMRDAMAPRSVLYDLSRQILALARLPGVQPDLYGPLSQPLLVAAILLLILGFVLIVAERSRREEEPPRSPHSQW